MIKQISEFVVRIIETSLPFIILVPHIARGNIWALLLLIMYSVALISYFISADTEKKRTQEQMQKLFK